MRIGTAEANSTFTTQGHALGQVLRETGYDGPIEIIDARFASTENAQKLEDGELDFGFIASNWVGRARRGDAPFAQPVDLKIVAPMNAGPMYFIASANSSIGSLHDLRGKIVSVGPENSGTRQHAASILSALGISFSDITPVYLDFANGAEALKRGDVDAQLQCPYPNRVMTALDASHDLKVIDLSADDLAQVISKFPVYRRVVLPSGSLRALKADSLQPAVLNVLVTHARADDELVESMAATIFRHASDLAQLNGLFQGLPDLFLALGREGEGSLRFDGVDLHPAARKAYRDAGLFEQP